MLATLLVALCACDPATPTPPTSSTTTAPSVPIATLGDEFDGSSLAPDRWRAISGTYGNAGGGSRHCLSPQMVTVGGGTLKIRSAKQTTTCTDGHPQPYASGFASSRDAGRYYPLEGTYAMRARIPAAQGIWPAFWLRHRNGAGTAEVDIMESFHAQAPGRASQVLHLDGETNTASRSTWFEEPTATPAWHEFSVDIRVIAHTGSIADDVRFDFAIDGRPTLSYVDVDPRWLTAASPAGTWDLAINTAVDGRWVGDPDGALGNLDQIGRCAQSGTYPACASTGIRRVDWSAPVVFEVDWVRVTPRAST